MTKTRSKKARFEQLMAEIHIAHIQFQTVWREAKAPVVGDAKFGSPEYYAANHHAYQVAAPESERVKSLLKELFWDELGEIDKAFLAGDTQAITNIIEFLEVDIPAFRCGYAKEWYLRKLKNLPLSKPQCARLEKLALDMCGAPVFRREFREMTRLMIKLAEEDLIEELRKLAESKSERIKLKSRRMLERILGNRIDLRAK